MPSTGLPPGGPAPWSISRDLPPYRGILAVDAKDFTGRPAVEHVRITPLIPQLLQQALERAGLGQLWQDQRFANNTGDGFVFGFDPTALPRVIHPFLIELQELLTDYNIHATATGGLRLRVSLHVGPLPDSGAPGDGNGTPRNDTHRLLDSRPVRAMLAGSSENTTHVAAILSQRVFEDAVLSGYTRLHPDRFIEVAATVEDKNFQQSAWLHVPAPSGGLYDRRILGEQQAAGTPSAPAEAPRTPAARPGTGSTVTYHQNRGFVSHGDVHGGQHQTNNYGDETE
ncbi:hypothetical protein FGW37_27685 [Streptomyces rectiverticillatus]|uniref:hypothetical protein n=1 Tax=Streptomyces rectiverticillatus TaxID=173860 RepID=UPI0015C2F016|nr:hypothetical protein [Streptomyces rectiverticillatus]QLE74872.1 hypothetical protein FGW37_27685 [Streptomyces rectiverticillatus]